jgi:hypothetical protein
MLLAERFTYIHEPKTGGTFVTEVLARLHGGLVDVPASRLRAPALRLATPSVAFYLERLRPTRDGGTKRGRYGTIYKWNDHGTCSEIPVGYRSRAIVATVRNPLETYVSEYLFGWWKRPEYVPAYERTVPDFRRRYSGFPDVSFRQYLELLHGGCTLPATRDLDDPTGVGYLTERFVRFYFRLSRRFGIGAPDPASVLERLDDAYIASGRFRGEMFDVRFLRTSRLNDELAEFLLAVGYDASDLEFVKSHEHVVPTGGTKTMLARRATSHDWRRYYDAPLEELVRRRERLIFSLFPELDAP